MHNRIFLTVFSFLMVTSSGCKLAKQKGSSSQSSFQEPKISKLEVSANHNSGKIPEEDWGPLEINSDGSVRNRLVLSLDFISDGMQSGVLPSCRNPYGSELHLANIVCEEGRQGTIRVFAHHVEQDCFSDAKYQTIKPKEALATLPGCHKARLFGFAFEKGLKLEIER